MKEKNRIYLNENGERVIGVQKIEDKVYLFDEGGIVQTGWQRVDGVEYYFSEETGERYEECIEEIDGIQYSFNKEGEYRIVGEEVISQEATPGTEESGWKIETIPEDDSVDRENENKKPIIESVQIGWVETEAGKKYLDETGNPLKGMQTIEGKLYYFDIEEGVLQFGWINVFEKRYFASESGVLYRNQLIWFGKTAYCMGTDGSIQYGIVNLNGTIYHIDEKSGQLIQKSGWIEKDGEKYFANANGVLYQNQLIWFGKTAYCMGMDGSVQYGIAQAGGKYYHTDEKSGQLIQKAGWVEKNGKKYYASAMGQMYQNQFIAFGTTWYYCGNDAAIVTGKQVVGGVVYNFDSNGIMKKEGGWGEHNGNKYYKNPATGFPYKNQWVTFGQTWYYANANGFMVSGWQTIKGYRYYFYPNTKVMARNTTIDGIRIGPDGKASTAYAYATNILNQVGWNLYAAFNWSAYFPYWDCWNSPAVGSETMALYGFQNGGGDCYAKAATFYYMALLLGYDAHQIAGFVPLVSGGLGVHSWVEINMNGTIYVYDPAFHQTGKNGYQFHYGASGTWRYCNYYRMN